MSIPGASRQKIAGLRQLTAVGIPVPRTIFLPHPEVEEERVDVEQVGREDAHWVIRIDAPPGIRFNMPGRVAASSELSTTIAQLVADLRQYRGTYGLVVQERIISCMEGLSIALPDGGLVIESQRVPGGHFVRDGTTPDRWILNEKDLQPAGLPAHLVQQLRGHMAGIAPSTCVEWLVEHHSGQLYFTDAKRLPSAYLAGLATAPGGSCISLLAGEESGRVVLPGHTLPTDTDEPLILVAPRTSVDMLPSLGPNVRGVVFGRGGLLAHAPVYAAALGVPMLICNCCEWQQAAQAGGQIRLVVAPAFHSWLPQ